VRELFDRPILVTGFNRPDLLKLVLEKLKKANCTKVFIAIDGPRADIESDFAKVAECQAIASVFNARNLDRNRLLESNLGCGLAMSSAIDWFFDKVDAGIIIEDDIDFGESFLQTMDYLLSELKDDNRVGSVTGLNPISKCLPSSTHGSDNSFIMHRFFSSWGWATWKNRWENYDFDLSNWESTISRIILWKRFGIFGARFLAHKFNAVSSGKIDTWDYQFMAMQIRYDLKCVAPVRNQVGNLGFRADATHTKSDKHQHLDFDSVVHHSKDLKSEISASRAIDNVYLRIHYRVPSFTQRVFEVISRKYPELR
jgi:hypothetical protein